MQASKLLTERKVSLAEVTVRMELSHDLVGELGQVILPVGTRLTAYQIGRLQELQVQELWVRDCAHNVRPAAHVQQEILTCYADTLSHLGRAFAKAADGETPDVTLLSGSLEVLLEECRGETNFLRLISALHSYDEYTFQHSIGVGLLSSRIGEWLGLSREVCEELLLAGALHDIGKCRIDDAILNKPGRLTPEEYEEIKHHATFGQQILRSAGLREEIVMAAYNHHERMNGAGYPRGIPGEQIDLYSRIVAVADVFHAMTSKRVYKGAQSVYRVLDELLRGAFGELDPQVVLVFVRQMTAFFIGNEVRLSDGTVGTVVSLRDDAPTRPLLRCADGFVDLLQRSELWIEELISV